jgi:hypothetical protein
MKTRTTPSMLITILLAFLALGVSEAQAIVVVGGRPVGITFGQTARVTSANTGTRAIVVNYTFLDRDGTILARFDRQVIEPGKMMSFDLNADDFLLEGERIEIRVVLSAGTTTGLVNSIQVFENDTGKTTVFVDGPDVTY